MRQTVFGKTTRPHGTHEAPTYSELTVANTLNSFDIGGGYTGKRACRRGIQGDGRGIHPEPEV